MIPINSIEGMFNGCVTRIAQAIKDPVNFGPSTKGVLFECSKRFQDALDDCTIQILDAKFYLEQQLALNKARREAKARQETAATAKRKHDEIKDADDKGRDCTKRIKLEDDKSSRCSSKQSVETARASLRPLEPPRLRGLKADEKSDRIQRPDLPSPQNHSHNPSKLPTNPASPSPPTSHQRNRPLNPRTPSPRQRPMPHPAPTNDDFNFESMFGEPSADAGLNDNDNDMPFELDLNGDLGGDFGAGLDATDSSQQNADLNSLLPGLESYANQAPEDPAAQANPQANPFDLPDLPNLGPNDFDAFLDANDFNAGGDINLNEDPMANLDNMDNMDFDSMF